VGVGVKVSFKPAQIVPDNEGEIDTEGATELVKERLAKSVPVAPVVIPRIPDDVKA